LSIGKFICFGVFWLINIWFIWKGTESIRWLEDWSAPILILIGIVLIVWGANSAGGFANALEQGKQLQKPTAVIVPNAGDVNYDLVLTPLIGPDGKPKATQYHLLSTWIHKLPDFHPITETPMNIPLGPRDNEQVSFKNGAGQESTMIAVVARNGSGANVGFWQYLMWFTAMLGYHAPRKEPEGPACGPVHRPAGYHALLLVRGHLRHQRGRGGVR
jgi:Permease for cytosine/purines, uracil, thiamine, allantoin